MADDLEAIKKLPPHERVKALKDLRERRRKELEELEKKRREELEESEDALEDSLEALEEDELRQKRKQQEALEQLLEQENADESLEETLRREKTSNEQEHNTSYQNSAYTPIQQIVEDLQGLSYTAEWGSSEQELYQQRKQELHQTKQYAQTMPEALVKQLDTAENILEKLGYKTL